MSQIKLTADSGGGTTSLKAPSSTTSNADVVLKLPVADGSSGQVLKTDGSGQLSFTSNAGTTINNNADNRIITGSDTASTLEGEANLTFDGTSLLTVHVPSATGEPAINFTNSDTGTGTGNGFGLGINSSESPYIWNRENTDLRIGTNNTERLRIDSDGKLLLNTTAVTNTSDQLTVKKPASGFGEIGLTVDANTSTNSAANAFVYTKSKHTYWNGYAFQSSHGYIGALLGKRDASGTTDQEIRMEIGGDSPNQNEEKTWTFKNNGDLSIDDGNLVLASGHGIDFSATFDGSNVSNVTSTSELLDDYEEGTFQPILKRLMTNNVTETNFYTQGTREGNYTRIGDRVWITGRIHWSGGSTGSGKLIMTNLPFTINTGGANEIPLNIGYRSGLNYTNVNAYGGQNMNRFYITYFDSNGTYYIPPSATDSSGTFYFAAHYELV